MYHNYAYYGFTDGLEVALMILPLIFVIPFFLLIAARYVAVSVLFTKAGDAPWKSIIPVYDMYTFFKLTWNTKMFIPYIGTLAGALVGAIGVAVVSETYYYYYGFPGSLIFFFLLMLACMIAFLVFHIMLCHHISRAYGQGAGYTVGLVFLEEIFLMILAFGRSEYRGANAGPGAAPAKGAGAYYYYPPQNGAQPPQPPVQPASPQPPASQDSPNPSAVAKPAEESQPPAGQDSPNPSAAAKPAEEPQPQTPAASPQAASCQDPALQQNAQQTGKDEA